jgi:hypothetical protein
MALPKVMELAVPDIKLISGTTQESPRHVGYLTAITGVTPRLLIKPVPFPTFRQQPALVDQIRVRSNAIEY